MHAFDKAVDVLRFKGVSSAKEEENALYIAILLHDIGHGPFSMRWKKASWKMYIMRKSLCCFMHQLNVEFNGQLNLAIQVFEGDYRKFMLQLISSQLDMIEWII
jgi:HD superfamily phosphohydrolase